jgi:tRNA 2-selenouridine synthase
LSVQKIHIDELLQLAKKYPVIDVRSPAEYEHAHIPGAHSLPLFDNEERKIVGTAYKQESREQAIKIGLDFFGPKMRKMVEEAERILELKPKDEDLCNDTAQQKAGKSKIVLLYCWRGGMRSSGVAWLLDLYGFKVYTLTGGYKKFRHYVLDTFKQSFPFKIVGGYTGSGKTFLLKELERKGETIIDLESIAKHKGSAFGNIGLPKQPTQEMFENLLATDLQSKYGRSVDIWLEDESQRIGLVNIPNDFWNNMRTSPVYFLEIPFEERLKHLVEEYGVLDKHRMIDAIVRIRERLGGQNAKLAIQYLEEGNTIESFRILLKYYDKWYLKGLHNREQLDSLLIKIACDRVDTSNVNQLLQQPVSNEDLPA